MKTPQTPAPELARALGLPNDLYLKREDLHPYGSHKGRSIPLMIKTYAKEGMRHFVISSSGNAALAAVHTVEQHNKNNPDKEITLKIFVGNNIEAHKLQRLRSASAGLPRVTIEQVETPKQIAFQQDKNGVAKNLRQSTDETALVGYEQLAEELSKIDSLAAIFIPTSSGTTAQALGTWFAEHRPEVEIHIVQSSHVHPIASAFDNDFTPTVASMASAIVDTVAHRSAPLSEVIKASHGSGWVVSDEEIHGAMQTAKKTAHIDLSPNSALAVAGLQKAIRKARRWNGAIVCLVTGV